MGEPPLMLGVSGCRGVVGAGLTPDVAARFAGAFGAWLSDRHADRPRVVVARDGRAGGHAFRHAALAGLCAAGCDVVDLGVEMTPTVGVMADQLDADGGMVLTASHNPQQWNGLKCLVRRRGSRGPDACAPTAADAAQIIARFHDAHAAWRPWDQLGRVLTQRDASLVHVGRVVERFGQDVLAAIETTKPRVVLDSCNASGVEAGRRLLERLGCRVVHIGNQDSGLFPHTPEPLRENLTELAEAVRAHGAIAGFAQDPDGDRLAIIDERGRYIGEEYTLALAARQVFEMGVRGRERQSRATAVNLSTSRMIEDVAAEFRVDVARTAVGEANVVEAMKARDMIIGGEGNGGVIWSSVTFVRDSLSAMALVLALVVRTNRQLSELVGMIPRYAIEKRKVDLASKADAAPAVQKLAAWGAAHPGTRVDRQDGVRVDWADCPHAGGGPAWVHVRASNTEPIMRLIAEARTPEGASTLLDETSRAIAG